MMADIPVSNKAASDWTKDDLVAWARGALTPSGQASDRTVAKEAVSRFSLEASDDVAVVKAQIVAENPEDTDPEADGTAEPAATEAAAPEAPATPAPVVTEAPTQAATVQTPEQAPAEAPLPVKDLAAPEPTEVKPLNRAIIEQNLAAYAKAMAIGVPHPAGEGAVAQVSLYRTIQTVLRQEGGEFTACFTTLLAFVKQYRNSLFNEAYVHRYFDVIRLAPADRRIFERLLNLLLTVCDPATRHVTIKQVDLNATLAGLNNSEQQQRVREFFTV